jgi:hypothetical protein
MHVFNAAEEAVEGGGEDDDGNVGAPASKQSGDFGSELTCAEVVVENGDVDVVEELGCFLDCGGRDALISMLPKNGGTEMQVAGLIVKQEDAHGG